MKLKTWAPAILALVLGLGAAMIFRNMMLKPHAPAVTAKLLQVVPATSDLIVGQQLQAENLSKSEIQTPEKPIDYVTNPADLVGRVLVKPVLKGQLIKESDMAPRGTTGSLPSLIPPGMRAMTIPVDEGNSQAGMLMPGCHVDVVGTFPNGRKSATRTLIKNVLVQAVGTRLTSARPEDGKEPGPYHTATLIVTEREAKLIDLTTNSGRLRLLLRGLMRSDGDGNSGDVSMTDIIGVDSDAAPSLGAPSTQPSAAGELTGAQNEGKYRVELMKGGTNSYVEFPESRVHPQVEANTTTEREKAIPGNDD
jgi:pilus assembly protein CpaB